MASKLLRTGLVPVFLRFPSSGIPFLVLKTDRRESFSTASESLIAGFAAPDAFHEQLDICRLHVGNNLSLNMLNQNQHNGKEGL
jgi:hypothetical protein